jgi:hypothetical protein
MSLGYKLRRRGEVKTESRDENEIEPAHMIQFLMEGDDYDN